MYWLRWKRCSKRSNLRWRKAKTFTYADLEASSSKRAAKIGRNIKKNVAVNIPEHFIPAFKPARNLFRRSNLRNQRSTGKEEPKKTNVTLRPGLYKKTVCTVKQKNHPAHIRRLYGAVLFFFGRHPVPEGNSYRPLVNCQIKFDISRLYQSKKTQLRVPNYISHTGTG